MQVAIGCTLACLTLTAAEHSGSHGPPGMKGAAEGPPIVPWWFASIQCERCAGNMSGHMQELAGSPCVPAAAPNSHHGQTCDGKAAEWPPADEGAVCWQVPSAAGRLATPAVWVSPCSPAPRPSPRPPQPRRRPQAPWRSASSPILRRRPQTASRSPSSPMPCRRPSPSSPSPSYPPSSQRSRTFNPSLQILKARPAPFSPSPRGVRRS